jgi:hypothetical protein
MPPNTPASPLSGDERLRLLIEVSPGEVIDKLTILAIKEQRLTQPDKLGHVRREAAVLRRAVDPLLAGEPALRPLMEALVDLNGRLWDIEDELRAMERRGDFGAEFVELARQVYLTNDRRAAAKAEINALLGSDIAEQKSYSA